MTERFSLHYSPKQGGTFQGWKKTHNFYLEGKDLNVYFFWEGFWLILFLCGGCFNEYFSYLVVIRSDQSLSHVRLFATPWTTARQPSLSIANSQSLLMFMSIESVMPSNHLILCRPLLLPPSICPSIRVFSNELALYLRWPKYWSFSFSISPSNEYSGLISFRRDLLDLFAVQGLWRVFSNTTIQKRQFFGAQPSLWPNSHIHTWLMEKP